MKYAALLILSATFLTATLHSQYRRSITVKAGEDVAQAFSPNGFYRFPKFSEASLHNRQRSGPSGMLFNYNILTDRIQFINNTGDTLDMINPTLFDSMIIDKTVFYFKEDHGFMELIGTAWPIRLVKKTTIKMKSETIGAYGTATTTSSVDRMKTYVVGTNVYNYKSNENMIIKQLVDWYWIGEDGRMMKATKKNLMIMLPPEKMSPTTKLIKENNIDFDKEADLIQLLILLRKQDDKLGF